MKKPKKKKKLRIKRLIVFIAIILLIIAAIFFYLEYDKSKKFIYHEREWKIERMNNLTFYTTIFSVEKTRINNQTNLTENYTFAYQLKLINDPRNIDMIHEEITEMPHKKVYFSIDKSIMGCKNNVLAAWEIGEFLGALNYDIEGAVTSSDIFDIKVNKDYLSKKVKNCKDADSNTSIVILQEGPVNQIYKNSTNEDCIIIEAHNCESLETVERYITSLIEVFDSQQE